MSSSRQLPMLQAKRSFETHFDSQFFSSKCKVRKVSAARKFPPNCGRFAQNNMASSGTTKAHDVAALVVVPQGANVNQNSLNGHNAEKCDTNDIVCVSLPEVARDSNSDKIRLISSQICILVDYISANFSLDDKVHFMLVVEKRDFGFQINWGDGDGKNIVLSHAEWDLLKLGSKCNEDFDDTRVETKKKVGSKCNEEFDPSQVGTEKDVSFQCTKEVDVARVEIVEKVVPKCYIEATKVEEEQVEKNQNELKMVVEDNKSLDFMELDSADDAKFDNFDGEVSEIEIVRDEAMSQYGEENDLAIVKSSLNPKCSLNRDLVNITMVHRNHPQAIKARETLELFEEYYTQLLHEPEKMNGKNMSQASNQAASRVKEDGQLISTTKPFGHVPGVEIGDKFRFRAELSIVGLHCQMIAGIDYVKLHGKIFATSIVNSGRYENEAKSKDVLIYSGQGGNSQMSSSNTNLDQKLERGNLALVNSKEMQYPIRVTFKKKRTKSETAGMRIYDYVYDGLYIIDRYWEERASNCKMVYKFELHRLLGQPRPREVFGNSRILTKFKDVCVLDDISNGLERVKIRVMNGIDDDKPLPFSYMSKMVYPNFFELINPVGCDCIDGCSDENPCKCIKRNGVEIPFNEHGSLIIKKPIVHECGPQCKCPPTCMNRVSQLGPQHQLEIFKTLSMGWGVRSRNYISMGSFICEYVGELLQDNDAGERIGKDEYLFDIHNDEFSDDGFVIDALYNGNFGRFFNHSCSPNLFAQDVMYDHGDTRAPHIMFFASTNIPPLKELTYDYNYKINQVRDKNGIIRKKDCHCGSRDCRGRMY